MTGKEKCAYLRHLREKIARDNGIPYVSTPCNYQGEDCLGTCPVCDREVQYLTNALREKEKRGETLRPAAAWELLAAHSRPEGNLPELDDEELTLDIPQEETGLVGLIEYAEPEPQIPEENTTVCPFCGRLQAPGNRFCVGCGSLMSQRTPGMEPAMRCGKCGAILLPGDSLCRYCGFDPKKPAPGAGFDAWCDYLDSRKGLDGGTPGNANSFGSDIAAIRRSPVRDQMDQLQEKVAEVMYEGDQTQILRLQRGLEDVLRWVNSMETKSSRARLEREHWEMTTPGVMVSNEDLKKKKRKGWF